jgi:hypothetical protein
MPVETAMKMIVTLGVVGPTAPHQGAIAPARSAP